MLRSRALTHLWDSIRVSIVTRVVLADKPSTSLIRVLIEATRVAACTRSMNATSACDGLHRSVVDRPSISIAPKYTITVSILCIDRLTKGKDFTSCNFCGIWCLINCVLSLWSEVLILAPIFLSDWLTVDHSLDRGAGMADRWIFSCFFKHVEDSLETFAEEPWIRTLF